MMVNEPKPVAKQEAEHHDQDRSLLMGTIVGARASSHAFAVAPPEKWDKLRERNRNVYAQRQNVDVPPPHPRLSEESWQDVVERYGRVRNGLLELKRNLEE